MAQKSNPISLRLKRTNKLWNSCWYGDYNYTAQLLQDRAVESHIQNICQQAKMAPPVVFINRQRQQSSTFFFFPHQQKINRIKRPPAPKGGRGGFKKIGREGADWFSKLFFWCRRQQLSPLKGGGSLNVGANWQSLPPATSPIGVYRRQQFLEVFQYLLVSHRAALNGETFFEKNLILPSVLSSLKGLGLSPGAAHNFPFAEGMHVGAIMQKSQALSPESPPTLRQFTPRLAEANAQKSDKSSTHFPFPQLFRPAPVPGRKPHPPFNNPATLKVQLAGQLHFGFSVWRSMVCPLLSKVGGGKPRNDEQYHNLSRRSPPTLYPPSRARVQAPEKGVEKATPFASHRHLLRRARRNAASPWRDHLEYSISAQAHHNCRIYFLLCPSVHQSPFFLATQLCSSLENRKTFRRLKDRVMQEIRADDSVKGARITCSGRVAARSKKAQKAKTESIQWGQTSLHVFSDRVHFASKSALTPFGKIGVKVWICYKTNHQTNKRPTSVLIPK